MNSISVIKIGGKVISDTEKLDAALRSFQSIPGPKILVHGGGSEASSLAEKMGVKVNMIEGRRITDKKMIDIVTMVYGGLVNKRIVAKLQSMGANAIGLSGADGNTIISDLRPVGEINYGYVGDIKNVNGVALVNLLQAGFIPIFCALTHDGNGLMLNTNADTIASEVAKELSKSFDVRLFYAFELPGVLTDISDEKSVISKIREQDFESMKVSGQIVKGMIPKIHNALNASKAGVDRVYIGQFCNLDHPEKGTEICMI